MKKASWSNVQASGDGSGSRKLPSGGYVVMITAVEDKPENEALKVTWDVADGPFKGKFADEWGLANAWAHQFTVSYKDSAAGLFKRFLDCLEKSNPSFNVAAWEKTCNEAAFVGKFIGVTFGTEYYVYGGKKRDRYTFPNWYATEEILAGEFKVPADKVSDEYKNFEPSAPATENQGGYYDDLPFA